MVRIIWNTCAKLIENTFMTVKEVIPLILHAPTLLCLQVGNMTRNWNMSVHEIYQAMCWNQLKEHGMETITIHLNCVHSIGKEQDSVMKLFRRITISAYEVEAKIQKSLFPVHLWT